MVTGVGQALAEHRVRDRREQQRIGARPDRHPLVGLFGGSRQSRIDDDHLAAARLDGLDATREVRSGTHAAVRCVRVGAEDHEVIGSVEVRHGDRHG